LLNETDAFCQISRGISMGFDAVMVENERLGLDEYGRLVKKVVEMAHGTCAAVEAAVGHLPNAAGAANARTHLTDSITPATAKGEEKTPQISPFPQGEAQHPEIEASPRRCCLARR